MPRMYENSKANFTSKFRKTKKENNKYPKSVLKKPTIMYLLNLLLKKSERYKSKILKISLIP
tara:strand:+ start:8707 stop:8892 length:186 start_codon:yes stop_codon:yes gene_type:complete